MSDRMGTVLNERYRLETEIGRGGMGVVYRAHDLLLQRDVAIKVLSDATLDSESRARLLREAQAVAQLNHPHIVSVYDAGQTEGVPFIVMEWVEGESLYDRPPVSLEDAVGIACQVCAALEHAHAHDIVHRDLKPENVLLACDGTAKLVDFGLARTFASRLTTEGAILGTLLYLAPEQAQGGEIDGRADLYALGVMLYEWAAGRLPFVDGPPAVILSHHLHTPAVPPREHNDQIPPALDALIVQLMSKRREDRPASAAEVRGALEALGQATAPAEAVGVIIRLPGFLRDGLAERVEQRPAFVAREGELAWLDGFLEGALEGQGQVVFVTGGPGRGKTALLDEFARRAMEAQPELLVAGGTCNAYSGVGDPYLPFREVLGMLTGDVEARWATGTISRDQARRLWQALPAAVECLLGHGPHVSPALVPGEALLVRAETACLSAPWLGRLRERVERERAGADGLQQSHLFQQVSNVLQALSEAHPLLLILDDLQWVDRTSAGLLFHLGRRLQGSRILIVGAYRPEELAPGPDAERHPLEKVLAEFKRIYGDVWLDLAEGEDPEGRSFVDAFLETEPNRLGEGFRQALAERSGGHPLFTVELLRAMQERGDLVRDEAGRWVEGPALDWELLPARVEGVIAERIGRLEGDLRDVLTVASVEGEDFTAEVVAQVRSIQTRQLVRRLSGELQKEHRLVRARGLRQLEARRLALYRFQHHLFQKYLYNHLDEAERAYLHEDVGTVLEALYGKQTDEVAVQLARHFLEAGVTDKAAHYLGRAGTLAAERYANEEALDHLSRALELAREMDNSERFGLLLSREKVHDLFGQRDAQREDLAELNALAERLGAEWQAEAANRQAKYSNNVGDHSDAILAAQEVVTKARAIGNTRLEAEGHLRLSFALSSQGDGARSLAHDEEALALVQRNCLEDLEVKCLVRLGAYHNRIKHDVDTARHYLKQAWRVCERTSNRLDEQLVLHELSSIAISQGAFSAAHAFLDVALRGERELGYRAGEIISLCGLAGIYLLVGDYIQAVAVSELQLRIAYEIEDRSLQSFGLSTLGEARWCLGDLPGARESTQQALLLAREMRNPEYELDALLILGRICQDVGELASAREHCGEALRICRETAGRQDAEEPLSCLASAELMQGNLIGAQNHVEEILEILDKGLEIPAWSQPGLIYLTCYRTLVAVGDLRAAKILETAYNTLMEQADRIGDEAMRRSFLENVPWHREIVAEWEARQKGACDPRAPA